MGGPAARPRAVNDMRASTATLCLALVLVLLIPGACAHTRSAPTGLLAEGDAARGHGAHEEARRAYEAALLREPGDVGVHRRYVALLLEQGQRSEALRVYRRRAAAAGAMPVDRVMHARLETDGSADALRGTYESAIREAPGEVWWRLALAEIEVAEAQAALARRDQAEARSDRKAAEAALDEARTALRRADAALAVAAALCPVRAEVALYQGLAVAVRGDLETSWEARRAAYERAREAFRRALRQDPDLVDAWEALGDAHARLGDHEESLAAYLMATAGRPADAHLRLAVGVELQRTGRHGEAAKQYEQAARLAPRDAEPWLRWGDALAEDERWAEALEAYEEALRRDPVDVEALLRQGSALEHLGRRDEARTSYERYLHHGGEREATVRRRIERLLGEDAARARP